MTHSPLPLAPPHSLLLTIQMAFCALAVVALFYIPIPILNEIAQTYQIPAAMAGYAISAFGIAYACGFLIFGPLSDRLGRQRVLVIGLICLCLSSLAFLIINNSTMFLVLRALQGLAAASFPPVALAYLAERGTPQQKTKAVAYMSTAFLCAGLLGQIYGSMTVPHWGFALALLPLCVIYVLTALSISKTGMHQVANKNTTSLLSAYSMLGPLLKNVPLQKVYLPALVQLMVFVAFYINIDRHFGPELRSAGISQITVRAIALPAFLAPLFISKWIQRFGPRKISIVGLFIAASGLVLTSAAAGIQSYSLILATSFIYALGVSISIPSLIARINSLAANLVRGLAISLYTFLLFIGASLGPWLAKFVHANEASTSFAWLAGIICIAAIWSRWPDNQ